MQNRKVQSIAMLLLLLLLVASSCAVFEEPDFEVEGIRMGDISDKTLHFTVDVEVDNPNWYALKVKKSFLDVSIENHKMGSIYFDEKLKITRKKISTYTVPLRAELENGALLEMMQYDMEDQLQVLLNGTVKAGVFFVSKKFPIDYKKTVRGSDLKVEGGL
jgi:LEA14-like dessication related protein